MLIFAPDKLTKPREWGTHQEFGKKALIVYVPTVKSVSPYFNLSAVVEPISSLFPHLRRRSCPVFLWIQWGMLNLLKAWSSGSSLSRLLLLWDLILLGK